VAGDPGSRLGLSDSDAMRFAESDPFTLGVEEELLLGDPRDGAQLNAGAQVLEHLAEPQRGEVKGEVHACQVELITDVCVNAADAMEVLRGLRRTVLDTGVALIGSGTHPTAEEGAADITDKDRYRLISGLLGDAADYTFHWWKLRPHPRLGTVEIRALDVQPSLAATSALVAAVHSLARHEATADPVPGPAPEILEEASFRAARTRGSLPAPRSSTRWRPWPKRAAAPGCSARRLATATSGRCSRPSWRGPRATPGSGPAHAPG
jgi:gamma-glutamyl:cysteine ligase YbdK (ATP-grasp superfamily)